MKRQNYFHPLKELYSCINDAAIDSISFNMAVMQAQSKQRNAGVKSKIEEYSRKNNQRKTKAKPSQSLPPKKFNSINSLLYHSSQSENFNGFSFRNRIVSTKAYQNASSQLPSSSKLKSYSLVKQPAPINVISINYGTRVPIRMNRSKNVKPKKNLQPHRSQKMKNPSTSVSSNSENIPPKYNRPLEIKSRGKLKIKTRLRLFSNL